MGEPVDVEQYRAMLLVGVEPLHPQQLPLGECLGLLTATTTTAEIAVPPFTNSAMDGFAVQADAVAGAGREHPVELQVTADLPAGSVSYDWIGGNQTVRIMTGAMLVAGADAVVPVELTDQPPGDTPLPEKVLVYGSVAPGANIRVAGEDVDEGDPVLDAGTKLTPAALAAAASTGHASLLVHPRPKVAVISTGSELVAPGQPLDRGQIPDSNSLLLASLAVKAGADLVSITRVGDHPDELDKAIAEGVAVADVVITSGGVSAGSRDVVKNSRTAEQITFAQVAMQPGKPQGYAHLTSPDGRPVMLLAFPGNPVGAFVSWYTFALPVLARLAGHDLEKLPAFKHFAAGCDWSSPLGRRQYIPVTFTEDGRVVPSHELGSKSHLIASLHRADGLAIVPADTAQVAEGDDLEVILVGD